MIRVDLNRAACLAGTALPPYRTALKALTPVDADRIGLNLVTLPRALKPQHFPTRTDALIARRIVTEMQCVIRLIFPWLDLIDQYRISFCLRLGQPCCRL